VPVSKGKVRFGGRDVTRLRTHRRAALGIGRTYRSPTCFPR